MLFWQRIPADVCRIGLKMKQAGAWLVGDDGGANHAFLAMCRIGLKMKHRQVPGWLVMVMGSLSCFFAQQFLRVRHFAIMTGEFAI